MKTLTQKGQRIIDNIFDLMLETPFLDQAKKEMKKDLSKHNVSVDKSKGIITIETEDGQTVLYEIKIQKV